jgi:hypothetical protein
MLVLLQNGSQLDSILGSLAFDNELVPLGTLMVVSPIPIQRFAYIDAPHLLPLKIQKQKLVL